MESAMIEMVRRKILPVLTKYGVKRAGLFGSLVKGNFQADSDIDVLVDLNPDLSLLDVIELKLALEDTLSRSVDLVEYNALKPQLRDRILNEEVPVL